MTKLIGKNKKVLDLGSGTSVLYNYLDLSCTYVGIEANAKFVEGARQKNLNIIEGNLFEVEFPKADVVVISDILHHIVPLHKDLIEKALRSAPVLVICEPDHSRGIFNFISNNRLWFKYFADNDGINSYEKMVSWKYTEKELLELLKKYGSVSSELIGNTMIIKLQSNKTS